MAAKVEEESLVLCGEEIHKGRQWEAVTPSPAHIQYPNVPTVAWHIHTCVEAEAEKG